MNTRKINVKGIAVSAVCGALGFVLMLLEFPIPFIIPSFIKLDFSEIPALIASFAYGPIYGILVCAVKNLLHLFVTTSGGVGELSNFILGAIFVGAAGIVYSKMHNRKGALIGSLVGAFLMALISVFTNYFIVYPAYVVIYGMPMEAILGMYKALLPAADNLWKALIIFNFPFNLAKGILDAAVCFLVYKRISPILKPKKK
ncbi:MAG: ECF transporter S component [Clostridia bacterium]|nr:ECF transporter S component [Clostridia bacterium]